MEIKQLIDDYIHWLKKEITFEKIGEYYEITTPFLNSANDFIQIYVRIDKDTIFLLMINIHTANLRPTKSLGVRETESMAVGD